MGVSALEVVQVRPQSADRFVPARSTPGADGCAANTSMPPGNDCDQVCPPSMLRRKAWRYLVCAHSTAGDPGITPIEVMFCDSMPKFSGDQVAPESVEP